MLALVIVWFHGELNHISATSLPIFVRPSISQDTMFIQLIAAMERMHF